MWVLKLHTKPEGTHVASLAKKFNICFSGHTVNFRKEKNSLLVQNIGLVHASPEKTKWFFEELKKLPMFVRIWTHGKFIVTLMREPAWLITVFNPYVIMTRPALYTPEGEFAEFASWSKKPLMDLVIEYKKHWTTRIVSFKREKVKNISWIGIQPDLTEKQRHALELASKQGYYEFPKKITLKELAKLSKCSYSTFRAHLSKAERDFIPFMLDRLGE
ncbi:hypothetical protein COV18_00920 [Candidatus Woesearchaeota archaeon CG10_big_fil_rev_8_21_14_0_10_37_12]|nr:MAG: hypothetical protein COV18_00920 [Candidatus Woesearchaeota archaeon CG10_big_fil_rev_8_21_14_0_10_37_12]